jgi:hypothetical protein
MFQMSEQFPRYSKKGSRQLDTQEMGATYSCRHCSSNTLRFEGANKYQTIDLRTVPSSLFWYCFENRLPVGTQH